MIARFRQIAREVDAEFGEGAAARDAFVFTFIGLALPIVAVGVALVLEALPC